MRAGANGPIEGLIDLRKSPDARRMAALESPALPQVPACQVIIKSGQEPTKPEPDVPDNLTQREPKSAMIASPAADNLKPLQVAASAGGLVFDGLLGEERRKTGWMRAEAAGDPSPWRQQAILGRGRWEADTLRDMVRAYVVEHLADENAVLVVDETGFLKQGKASCGVARQYTGSAGKITN